MPASKQNPSYPFFFSLCTNNFTYIPPVWHYIKKFVADPQYNFISECLKHSSIEIPLGTLLVFPQCRYNLGFQQAHQDASDVNCLYAREFWGSLQYQIKSNVLL